MIICNARTGQMSNRLCVAAHALAFALSRKETIVFTELDFAQKLFECTPPEAIKVVVRKSRFWALERLTLGRLTDKINSFRPPATGLLRNRCLRLPGLTAVSGFVQLRDEESVQKYHEEVCAFFRPRFLRDSDSVVCRCLSRDKKNIGVHIRRKDYRVWQGGRYFFGDEVYCKMMRQVARELDARFILFSDEALDMTHFTGLDCIRAQGSAVEDQWLMSRCDYLMGPPSTFSGWASYYGQVPRATITDPGLRLSLTDFVVQKGC